MPKIYNHVRRLCFALTAILPFAAQAGQITVISSFSKEVMAIYKEAFEKKNPDIKVEMVNKNTNAALKHIRETAVGQRPEVFWASSPGAFELLSHEKLLEKLVVSHAETYGYRCRMGGVKRNPSTTDDGFRDAPPILQIHRD